MSPVAFDGCNCMFGPSPELTESQCITVPAYCGQVEGGSLDGGKLVVVAWRPSPVELAQLNAGAPVFLSCLGGLPPHFLTTDFAEAQRVE